MLSHQEGGTINQTVSTGSRYFGSSELHRVTQLASTSESFIQLADTSQESEHRAVSTRSGKLHLQAKLSSTLPSRTTYLPSSEPLRTASDHLRPRVLATSQEASSIAVSENSTQLADTSQESQHLAVSSCSGKLPQQAKSSFNLPSRTTYSPSIEPLRTAVEDAIGSQCIIGQPSHRIASEASGSELHQNRGYGRTTHSCH